MQSVQFKITGLAKLQSKLKAMPVKMANVVDSEIRIAVTEINDEQVKLSPIDEGGLRGVTGWRENKQMDYSLFSNIPYAAYMEFGTGKQVDVPAGLESVAASVKGKSTGSFAQMLENLTGWVKRKGIAEQGKERQVAFLIARKILRDGLRPRPFFFTPYLAKKDELVKNIAKAIKNIK